MLWDVVFGEEVKQETWMLTGEECLGKQVQTHGMRLTSRSRHTHPRQDEVLAYTMAEPR